MTVFNLFKNDADVEVFQPKEIIFKEGDPGDKMYIIQDGEVEILVNGQSVEIATTSDIIGEMSLIDKTHRSATVVANTECKLVPINQKRFIFLVQQHPYFALEVMTVLANRLRKINRKV